MTIHIELSTKSFALMLIVFCCSLLVEKVDAQTNQDKITPKEYIEANEFARKFWKKLSETKDLKPLIGEFGTKDFYRCLGTGDFAFLRDDQLRPARVAMIKRYYVAEANFMLLFVLWSQNTSGLTDSESSDIFSQLPGRVKRAFPKKTWDAIEKNDSNYDADKPQSDKSANEYFDRVMIALEKAAPAWRKELVRIKAGQNSTFRINQKEIEKNFSYAFRPEVNSSDRSCRPLSKNERVIIVDVPFFQLTLVREDNKLKVLSFPFHID